MKQYHWVGFLPFYLFTVIVCIAIAAGGSRTATVVSQNKPIERQHRIVIDAGHGGIDTGATSCNGRLESFLNLEIALRLEALLRLLGMDTVMIRRSDTSVYTEGTTIAAQKISDLKERVRIIHETDHAVLVSIHQNTFSDSQYSGAQVFYGKNEDSKRLAHAMQEAMVAQLNKGSKRKCKQADGIYLLQNIQTTGILIECGFLSNPQEEALLHTQEYQKKLICIIASVLSQYANSG